jgi:hypothetical protein
MPNDVIQEKRNQIIGLQYELRELEHRKKLINQLGLDKIISHDYLTHSTEEIDGEITLLFINGQMDVTKYTNYFTKRNGFRF